VLVWSNGKYLLLRSRAVYGLNSDDSEIKTGIWLGDKTENKTPTL
jgi:hypothetical protein